MKQPYGIWKKRWPNLLVCIIGAIVFSLPTTVMIASVLEHQSMPIFLWLDLGALSLCGAAPMVWHFYWLLCLIKTDKS